MATPSLGVRYMMVPVSQSKDSVISVMTSPSVGMRINVVYSLKDIQDLLKQTLGHLHLQPGSNKNQT